MFSSAFSQEVIGIVHSAQDGDSFRLYTPDSLYKVRLNSIDCPEINQPFGEEAREFLSSYKGDTVSIIKKEIDKYGRTIADMFYKDTLINLRLIENGLAWHFKKYSSDTLLANAEIVARDRKLGLWADEAIVSPWDWRSGNYDHSIFQDDKAKVFICIEKEDLLYHNVHNCDNLKKCTATVILVFPSEATGVYRKSKCSKCFK